MTAAVPIVFAHTGHVLVDLATFLGPVVVVGVLLLIGERRQKRAGTSEDDPSDA
jgi:hypothetical protein